MKEKLSLAAALALLGVLAAFSLPARGQPGFAPWDTPAKGRHHHDLRGVITKVEPENHQFEIKTDRDRIVLCYVDDKSTLRRGTAKITLKEVRVGDRARCHCVAQKEGRHYSQSLLLEKKDRERP